MPLKKRKVRSNLYPEDPTNSDGQVNYIFDEDYEYPFLSRPRICKSSIVTRSRSKAFSVETIQTAFGMVDQNAEMQKGTSQQSNIPASTRYLI